MNPSTPMPAGQAGRAGSRARAWLPRLAALAIAGFFVVPLGWGIALVRAGVEGPPCMEYCDSTVGGRVWIAIAVIGLGFAIAIWRRHLFAVAIAMCLGVVAGLILLAFTAVTVIGLDWPVLGEAAVLVGLTGAVGLTVILLGLVLLDALRMETPALPTPDLAVPDVDEL